MRQQRRRAFIKRHPAGAGRYVRRHDAHNSTSDVTPDPDRSISVANVAAAFGNGDGGVDDRWSGD